MARLVPEVAFKFVMHDQFKVMFTPPEGKPFGMSEKLAAGAATGAGLVGAGTVRSRLCSSHQVRQL